VHEPAAAPAGVTKRGPMASIEWPTVVLGLTIYGGWLALTWWHAALPGWVSYPALAWLVAWHGSLQHEVLHGHPTRIRGVNDAIGFPPLALWLPYAVYRSAHLRHHVDVRLTDPLDDPESRYWTDELWQALSWPGRVLVTAQGTLLGRLLLGPAWGVGRFYSFQFAALRTGHAASHRIWAWHTVGVCAVLIWVWGVCQISPLLYILFVVYPAISLTMIRSFAEHKAADHVAQRIAIVEHAPVLGLLFLHNNLHVVHHDMPGLPWYRIPAQYRQTRDQLVAANGGLLYNGYFDVIRRFLLTPHDRVLHPRGRVPVEEAFK
jgi:fatty acid desaturase